MRDCIQLSPIKSQNEYKEIITFMTHIVVHKSQAFHNRYRIPLGTLHLKMYDLPMPHSHPLTVRTLGLFGARTNIHHPAGSILIHGVRMEIINNHSSSMEPTCGKIFTQFAFVVGRQAFAGTVQKLTIVSMITTCCWIEISAYASWLGGARPFHSVDSSIPCTIEKLKGGHVTSGKET